ncbi:hypothetical protein ACOSQ4_013831 [Xanthoceras sorbifolium]
MKIHFSSCTQLPFLCVKVDFPWAAPPPSWWPILSDLPRLPASFFFSLQYEETRAVQGFRTFLPVVPSYRSSLWAVIVIFWAVFELLVLAPIRPSDRRLRSAGRDRVFPSSSFSDPLSVREIGEAMKVEAEFEVCETDPSWRFRSGAVGRWAREFILPV